MPWMDREPDESRNDAGIRLQDLGGAVAARAALSCGMTHGTLNGMSDATITMDGSGRLVIPKEIRRLLHLTSGSELRPSVVGNRLELTPVEPAGPKPRKKSGLMVVPRSGRTFDAVAALAAVRESRP